MACIALTLKIRLLLTLIAALLAVMLLGSALVLQQARTAVQSEVRSGRELLAAVEQMSNDNGPATSHGHESQIEAWLRALAHMRHVEVLDSKRSASASEPSVSDPTAKTPDWFVRLMQSDDVAEEYGVTLPLSRDRRISLRTRPEDEIEEAWTYVRPLLALSVGMLVLVGVLAYAVLRRGLQPLDSLMHAFQYVEQGRFDIHLASKGAIELIRIEQGFNHMASVLRGTLAENRQLGRRLVTLQEHERKDIASELHDELAPILFSVRVDVMTATRNAKACGSLECVENTKAIEAKISQIQEHIDALLQKLRPGVLDDMGLEAAISALLDQWRRRQPQTCWDLQTSGLDQLKDEELRLAIYRITQESLTNAVKHAAARRITVEVRVHGARLDAKTVGNETGSGSVTIDIEDDGCGLTPGVAYGQGLRGIRDRVQALAGVMTLGVGGGGQGLHLHVEFPVERGSVKVKQDTAPVDYASLSAGNGD